MTRKLFSNLFSNAVNLRRGITILFNRIALLIYSIVKDIFSLTVVTKGIGLHGGLLFNTNKNSKNHNNKNGVACSVNNIYSATNQQRKFSCFARAEYFILIIWIWKTQLKIT